MTFSKQICGFLTVVSYNIIMNPKVKSSISLNDKKRLLKIRDSSSRNLLNRTTKLTVLKLENCTNKNFQISQTCSGKRCRILFKFCDKVSQSQKAMSLRMLLQQTSYYERALLTARWKWLRTMILNKRTAKVSKYSKIPKLRRILIILAQNCFLLMTPARIRFILKMDLNLPLLNQNHNKSHWKKWPYPLLIIFVTMLLSQAHKRMFLISLVIFKSLDRNFRAPCSWNELVLIV